MAESLGTWVYGVANPFRVERLAFETGVDKEPVRTVESARLAAVVGSVDLDEFGEEALRRNLEDLSWLETRVRAHHRIIEAAASAGPIVPMRFAVVFRNDARVGAMLEERRDELGSLLCRMDGRAEWGVKVYLDPSGSDSSPDTQSAEVGSSAGTAYLLRRRAQLAAQEEARSAAALGAKEVHATLDGLAVAARCHPPQDPRLTGESARMVLNGAYLLDDEHIDEFLAAAAALDDRHPGLRVGVTGPWPPYSFATVDEKDF